MNTSDNIDKIVPAWVAALQEVANVTEDANGHHGKYASLGACLAAVKPVLAKHGLVHQPYTRPHADQRFLLVNRVWHAESGQWIEDEGLPMPAGNDPQKMGGAVTYARRYSATTFFNITTTDDDAQAVTEHIRKPRQTRPQQSASDADATVSPEAQQVFAALQAHAGTPVAEHMKQWAAAQADAPPSPFKAATLDAFPDWMNAVANELADQLEGHTT